MTRKGIEAGRAFITLGVNDETQKQLRRISRDISKWAADTAKAGGLITAPIALVTRSFMTYGDEIDKAAQRTRMSTDDVQSLSFALEQAGAKFSDIEPMLTGFSQKLVDARQGSKSAIQEFANLGLSIDDIAKMEGDDILRTIVDHLNSMEDSAERAGAATKLLGEQGARLFPVLKNLRRDEERFREMGIGLTPSEIQAAKQMAGALTDLRFQSRKLVATIGGSLSPAFQQFTKAIGPVMQGVGEYLKRNPEMIQGLTLLGSAMLIAAGGASALSFAMRANPFFILAVSIFAAYEFLKDFNEELEKTNGLLRKLSEFTIGGRAIIETAAKRALDAAEATNQAANQQRPQINQRAFQQQYGRPITSITGGIGRVSFPNQMAKQKDPIVIQQKISKDIEDMKVDAAGFHKEFRDSVRDTRMKGR